MTRRTLRREFKIEAVRLVTERAVAAAQAARNLDVAASVLRRWMRELTVAPAKPSGERADLAESAALKKGVARLRAERDILKKAAVGSTGQRNGSFEGISRRLEARRFWLPCLEPEADLIQIMPSINGQVRAVREVLAQQAIGVFVAAARPGAFRVTEVNADVCRDGELAMTGQFRPAIPSQLGHHALWQMLPPGSQGADDIVAVLVGNLDQHPKRELRSTSVAMWLFLAPLGKSPSQWPGMARSSISAGRSPAFQRRQSSALCSCDKPGRSVRAIGGPFRTSQIKDVALTG